MVNENLGGFRFDRTGYLRLYIYQMYNIDTGSMLIAVNYIEWANTELSVTEGRLVRKIQLFSLDSSSSLQILLFNNVFENRLSSRLHLFPVYFQICFLQICFLANLSCLLCELRATIKEKVFHYIELYVDSDC